MADVRHPADQILAFKEFILRKPVFKRDDLWVEVAAPYFEKWYNQERGRKAAENEYLHSLLRRVSFDSGSKRRIVYPVRLSNGEWIHVAAPLVDQTDLVMRSIVLREIQELGIAKDIPDLQTYYQYLVEHGEPIGEFRNGKLIRKTDEVEG